MFPRVLLDTPEWYMSINWFGMGALRVTDQRNRMTRQAHPLLKSYFLQTMEALQGRGVPLIPTDPRTLRALLTFASIVMAPDSLHSRTVLSQLSPEDLATRIANSSD